MEDNEAVSTCSWHYLSALLFKWVLFIHCLPVASWTWNTFIDLLHAWEYQYNRQIVPTEWQLHGGTYPLQNIAPGNGYTAVKYPTLQSAKRTVVEQWLLLLFTRNRRYFLTLQAERNCRGLSFHCCGFHLIGYEYKSNQLPLLSFLSRTLCSGRDPKDRMQGNSVQMSRWFCSMREFVTYLYLWF